MFETKPMKKVRKIILRTETFERVTLRQSSKTINQQTLALGVYKVEIRRVEPEKEQIVFEAEILGFIEIAEAADEIRLVCRKN
jgi:hypothetical protein